jgi:hypothetical protein
MTFLIRPFTDEQARCVANLAQQYDAWLEVERAQAALPYNLVRKDVKGHAYLYELFDREGNGKSLGPFDNEAEQRLNDYLQEKTALKERRQGILQTLDATTRMYRALRLPLIDSPAGEILRKLDSHQFLGRLVMVVGTNAIPVYFLEANAFIVDMPDQTADFDLAWAPSEPLDDDDLLFPILKEVDSTYTVNTERPFQARNAKAYEVELLVAPSRVESLNRKEQLRPVPLPEQEWLLNGRPVEHVVVTRDLKPARIIAPDPRWFALHKLWMSEKPARNRQKKPKDRKQGQMLLAAIEKAMPHYPLDEAFTAQLPPELLPHFEEWRAAQQSDLRNS